MNLDMENNNLTSLTKQPIQDTYISQMYHIIKQKKAKAKRRKKKHCLRILYTKISGNEKQNKK